MWTKLLGVVITPLLNFIWDKISLVISRMEEKNKDEKRSEETRKKLEGANTKEERESAAEDVITKF